MKQKKHDILYSDPVREIMGNPPRRIIRWGSAVLFSVFVLFILISWFIRYPDTVPATIEITTRNPPVTMVSKITGRIIKLYVQDNEAVLPGRLLVVMETSASIGEIETLNKIIDTLNNPANVDPESMPVLSGLAEVQEYYGAFIKNLNDYHNVILMDYYGNKINSTQQEINALQEYIKRLDYKEKLYIENQKLETNQFIRDSGLFIDKFYSESDIEKSRQRLINIKIELQQVRLDQSAKEIELAQKKQLLQDYRIQRDQEKEKYHTVMEESLQNLKAQLKLWEYKYLIKSPVEGTVSFTKYWSVNQTVTVDEPVLYIVPNEPGEYVGRINLKMQRYGKVKTGKVVNIKLSGYPYLEFGMVKGVVKSMALVPTGDSYIIEVELPDGLTTLYGKDLPFKQYMQGTAEIITEDLPLLQRIVNPFRYLITKNRRQ
jgi:HlyD family secretion protein